MGRGAKKPAFTLLELLVVISVTTVMIGILLPAIRKTHQQAKLVLCASNLRQNYIALDTYAKQYHDSWPGADYQNHTNQFHAINSTEKNGPIYYLWRAGFVEEPKLWYCPAGKETPEKNWQNSAHRKYQPIESGSYSGYQFRMRLAFYNPSGNCSKYSAAKKYSSGFFKPDNFRQLAVFTDAFGNSDNRLTNHPGGKWNVLFNDSSVIKRHDQNNTIEKLDLSWWQAGDWRLNLPNGQKDTHHHLAFLWHFFDNDSWKIENKTPI